MVGEGLLGFFFSFHFFKIIPCDFNLVKVVGEELMGGCRVVG